jgi:hypothetical protein
MADSLSERAPKGLSAGSRRRWVEQVRALDEAGMATPARLELVGAWATALDSRDHALAVWQEAGRPETEAGSQGQERRHHLAVAVEKAEAALAGLTGKLERSAARRPVKRSSGLPPGAQRVELDGETVVVGEDGRLLERSAYDGRWILACDEQDYDVARCCAGWARMGYPSFIRCRRGARRVGAGLARRCRFRSVWYGRVGSGCHQPRFVSGMSAGIGRRVGSRTRRGARSMTCSAAPPANRCGALRRWLPLRAN